MVSLSFADLNDCWVYHKIYDLPWGITDGLFDSAFKHKYIAVCCLTIHLVIQILDDEMDGELTQTSQ